MHYSGRGAEIGRSNRATASRWMMVRSGISGAGKCPRAAVAMRKGMKGLRGHVKPQESPFTPGYTGVHPPVRLVAIAGCQWGS